jgi:hypothetical protein
MHCKKKSNPNSPWPGIIKLIPARKNLVCDIPAGDRNIANLFHSVSSLCSVEGLYCKRPIQCLASSEILTTHPLTARRVCTPRLWCGGRTHSLGREGVGGSIVRLTPDTALYSTYVSTLCFVATAWPFGHARSIYSLQFASPGPGYFFLLLFILNIFAYS